MSENKNMIYAIPRDLPAPSRWVVTETGLKRLPDDPKQKTEGNIISHGKVIIRGSFDNE